MRLMRDGVGLAVEEQGPREGGTAPPVLLVHGIPCDRRFLAPQLEHFAGTHRTVAVDLRGHGQSDAPEQEYTIEGFVEDLAWTCEQLALARSVVIGHSLGGIVALGLAGARPDLVGSVVALDAVLAPPPERATAMRTFLDQLRAGDDMTLVQDYFGRFFGPVDDPTQRAWILASMASTPRHVMLSTWENGFFGFDTVAAAAACSAPLLYLDAGTPNTDLAELARACPSLVVGRAVGSGHFLQLEVPNQVNAMIERFLVLAAAPTRR